MSLTSLHHERQRALLLQAEEEQRKRRECDAAKESVQQLELEKHVRDMAAHGTPPHPITLSLSFSISLIFLLLLLLFVSILLSLPPLFSPPSHNGLTMAYPQTWRGW